jgi:glycerol-3-phosphate dehydrogenase
MTPETVSDIVVIGGGLLGAAVARDAAQRGLSVMLFEKEDFGALSAMESRLVLGSLPALTTLDFTRVREDVREREILLQTATHLVRPQPCLLPFYHTGLLAQTRMRASLALSDALGFDPSLNFDPALPFEHLPRVHQILSVADTLRRAPGLRPDGLTGAARVWEAVVQSPARLVLEMVLDARRYGARLRSHTLVSAICRLTENGLGAAGVRWTDQLTGEMGHTQASLVIVAAGTGGRQLSLDTRPSAKPRLTKSVALRLSTRAGSREPLLFPQENGLLRFVIPNHSGTVLGTFETDYTGDPGAAYVTGAESKTLLQILTEYLPGLSAETIHSAEAAVFCVPSSASEIVDWPHGVLSGGLLCLSGGNLTDARRLAEEAVDLACRKLGRSLATPPCRTAVTSLPLPPDLSALPLPAVAEYAVAEEECRTLTDFLQRRLPPSYFVKESLPLALETLSALLHWDTDRQAQEQKAWESAQALSQTFRVL